MAKNKKRPQKSLLRNRFLISGAIFLLFFVFSLYFRDQASLNVEILKGLSAENIEKIELERSITEMVKGYPIEKMIPYIIEQDPKVAVFLISIAKKESDWGKKVPKYQGRDCFNYWGYRGPNRIASGGHSCFNSREEAVDIVGERIESLVYNSNLDTPTEMIVWKCGSSCLGHSAFGIKKWISDVSYYYKKLQDSLH